MSSSFYFANLEMQILLFQSNGRCNKKEKSAYEELTLNISMGRIEALSLVALRHKNHTATTASVRTCCHLLPCRRVGQGKLINCSIFQICPL
jgi:hypothetical protein